MRKWLRLGGGLPGALGLAAAASWLAGGALAQPLAEETARGLSGLGAAVLSGVCIFGGALLGMALGRVVPPAHLGPESRDAIKIGAGMISLMAALVLGLLVSSAKNNFDATNAAITQGGARIILLDRLLAQYGGDAEDVRAELRRTVAASIVLLWPEEGAALDLHAIERTRSMERMLERIRSLRPENDGQQALKAQAQQLANDVLLTRWIQIEQAQTTLPSALLRILLFWLTMLYLTFGLIAPRNATVLAVLLVGALSLATAVFLILEMNDPTSGVIKFSSGPLRNALDQLGR